MHNCDIYSNGDWSVECVWWSGGDHTILDFENNYWHGAENAEDIAAAIWDANDTEDLMVEIDFTPFSDQPLPTEDASWGDVKAMYLGTH